MSYKRESLLVLALMLLSSCDYFGHKNSAFELDKDGSEKHISEHKLDDPWRFYVGRNPRVFELAVEGEDKRLINECSFAYSDEVVLGEVIDVIEVNTCEDASDPLRQYLEVKLLVKHQLKGILSDGFIDVVLPYKFDKGVPGKGDQLLVGIYTIRGRKIAMPYLFAAIGSQDHNARLQDTNIEVNLPVSVVDFKMTLAQLSISKCQSTKKNAMLISRQRLEENVTKDSNDVTSCSD